MAQPYSTARHQLVSYVVTQPTLSEHMKTIIITKAVAAGLCLLSMAAQAESKFSLVNLAYLSAGAPAQWTSINNAGAIAGTVDSQLGVYSNGVLSKYEVPHLDLSTILISNNGSTVYRTNGNWYNFETNDSYVLQNGVSQQVTPLYPSVYRGGTYATAVNDSGVVVGTGSHYNYECSSGDWGCEYRRPWSRAIVYKDGKTTDLGTLGGNEASATDINNQGVIVGTSSTWPQVTGNVFVYNNGAMHALGRDSSTAVQINDAAQIAGSTYVPEPGTWHGHLEAWVYDGGEITIIGLDGESNTVLDLNNAGQAIGKTERGFWLYSDGTTIDLNTLLYEPDWKITGVLDLNDNGQILATAIRDGRDTSYVLLTPDLAPVLLPPGVPPTLPLPVPEPGTYAMLISGLGVLAAWRRRRA